MATTAMVARALGRCRLPVATNMPWCNFVEGAFPRLVSRTRVTVAAAALVAAQALCCSTESSGRSPAGGDGGGGVAGVGGWSENGGSPECYDCSLIGWCEGKSAINPEQDECGCTDTVTLCKDLCVLNSYRARCTTQCGGEVCPLPFYDNMSPCCTDAGTCGAGSTSLYESLCVPIAAPAPADGDCPGWKGRSGCCQPGTNLCGILDPVPSSGCVDPKHLGVELQVDCDGAVLDAGTTDAGGADASDDV